MKNTGIMRKIDELGRIVIPVDIRRKLNINPNDFMEVYIEKELIVFKKCKLKGVGKKVDGIGRINIPCEIRIKLNIKENDLMEIYIKKQTIILKKHIETCIFCGNYKDIVNFSEKSICINCLKKIQNVTPEIKG